MTAGIGKRRERIEKSTEAMTAAIEIYNNPNIEFKSEAFITLAIIAWTYLIHAYYQSMKIDFRYSSGKGHARRYDRTKYGAYKYWELEKCITLQECPLDAGTRNNLLFLIGIRHEIEHQLTHKIDEYVSAKLQACAQDYEHWLCTLFGEKYSISDKLAIAIQLSPLGPYQERALLAQRGLAKNVRNFVVEFESSLDEDVLSSMSYAYRVVFSPITVNRKGQADQVVEFVPADSPLARGLSARYALIKQTEKPKYRPSDVVEEMHNRGFISFSMHDHTLLWQREEARNSSKGYGVWIHKSWYWYESWVSHVDEWCQANIEKT